MRRLTGLSAVPLVLVLAACGGAAAPSVSPGPTGTPTSSPAPSGVVNGTVFRAWTTQALPPPATFSWGSTAVISDGQLVTSGPITMIYPGPLLPNLIGRTITPAGVDRIFEAAHAAGLLTGPTDLTGGIAPGGMTAHLLFLLDGQEREVIGDPNKVMVCIAAPCVPPAGSPEAFGQFWSQANDVAALAQSELGPEQPYQATRIAVLVTDPPKDDGGLKPGLAQWPLTTPLREFGSPFGAGTDRCGVVQGADLARLVPAVRQANALTQWTDGTTGGRVLVVRPLVTGEPSPCG
jgi:hypothetical protein